MRALRYAPPLARRLEAGAGLLAGRSCSSWATAASAWRPRAAPIAAVASPSAGSAAAPAAFRQSPRTLATAAAGAASEAALEHFRRRAGAELAAAAELTAGGLSATQLGRVLGNARDDALQEAFGKDGAAEARSGCEALIEEESKAPLAVAAELEEHHRTKRSLKAERADILAIGFQTTGSENQEFASLIVCATAGIFAVSIHASFFSIWLVAYLLYRRSTKQTRLQRAALDDLEGLVLRLRQVEEAERERREALKATAEAWSAGRAG